MDDDNFEDDYQKAVEAGQRNLRAKTLLKNWCFHAEFVRSPGRGMIEEATGFPIGHMGVQCKYSRKGSMQSWLLEDSAYEFYKNNCESCEKRSPVGFPNIMDFIGPREKAAEERQRKREEQEKIHEQKRTDRQKERSELRYQLSLKESFVLDLLDELDQKNVPTDDPRLEQLAKLAPETFTRKIIKHLLPSVLNESLPYSIPAAKALLSASLQPKEKLPLAVLLISNSDKSQAVINVILSNSEKLSEDDLNIVLHYFISMAVELPPNMQIWSDKQTTLTSAPIKSLFQDRHADICKIIEGLFVSTNIRKIEAAAKILLAIDNEGLFAKHTRNILTKLMRRRLLLPQERRDSSVIYYLREAASKCFGYFPEETDKPIQSLLADRDKAGRKEACKVYESVLKMRDQEKIEVGAAQRIAFKRLLWAAVEHPENDLSEATEFFRHSRNELASLAVDNLDELIGAAATLSERYDQADTGQTLELPNNLISHIDKDNKLSAIDRLQRNLIEWAALGAKTKGFEGIKQFITLYRGLPKEQTKMRGNIVVHLPKLLIGVESLTLILSDWYSALMDESIIIRAKAAQAWESVPYEMVKNFPNLFFEAFSVLFEDPYIIVHRSAVRSLRQRSFPDKELNLIKPKLWNLVFYYSEKAKKEDFLVDCINTLASLCLSSEERKGVNGQLLVEVLLKLEGSVLYHAVNRLSYSFNDTPGFVKVALKSIQDDYTRHVSIDDSVSAILKASSDELKSCKDDIKKALNALKPFRPEGFIEALLYATVLTKAGCHDIASAYFREMIVNIPEEDRHNQWLLSATLVEAASAIENAIDSEEAFSDLIEHWNSTQLALEKENEQQAKFRYFPTEFLVEN